MRLRVLASGFFLFFLIIISILTPSAMAKSSHSTKGDSFKHFLVTLPWWGYLLIAFVCLVLILIVFQRVSKRKRRRSRFTSHSSQRMDPVTVRPAGYKVIPGNAQNIGTRSEQQDAFGFSEYS